MLVLIWWLIPIGAAAVATWWVYAIAPSDSRDPNKPRSRRELHRMQVALGKAMPGRVDRAAPAESDIAPAVIDLTDTSDKSA